MQRVSGKGFPKQRKGTIVAQDTADHQFYLDDGSWIINYDAFGDRLEVHLIRRRSDALQNREESYMKAPWKRGISQSFVDDLCDGLLQPVLALSKADDTLSLCVRNGYINIYYRGGSLLKIEEHGNHTYRFIFDPDYQKTKPNSYKLPSPDYGALPKNISSTNPSGLAVWIANIPLLKCAMDIWFGQHHKQEREFQQLVERSNNCDYRTDYFACDIEYTHPDCTELRADILAIRWLSTQVARKKHDCADLAIIEMKFRDGSLNSTTQSAGLVDHVIKLRDAVHEGRVSFGDLAEEMRIIFNQRVKLGLVECHSEKGKIAKELTCINGQHPQFILLLADHDPDSRTLRNELTELLQIEQSGNLPFGLRVATANFMGYGLYDENIYPLSDFIKRFPDQI